MNQLQPRDILERNLADLALLLRRFEELTASVKRVSSQFDHRYKSFGKPWRGGARFLLSVIAIPFIYSQFIQWWRPPKGTSQEDVTNQTMLILGLSVLVGIVVGFAVVALQNLLIRKRNARIQRKNDQIFRDIQVEIAPEIEKIEQMKTEARHAYHTRFAGFFPIDYLNSVDVGTCWELVRKHRALTVTDAINLMEAEERERARDNLELARFYEMQRQTRIAEAHAISSAGMQAATIASIWARR